MIVQNPKRITRQELYQLGLEAQGSINRIYLHWTAGHYGQAYDDYHINIDKEGEVYLTCQKLTEFKYHTYRRNSSAIGIALCCGYDAQCGDAKARSVYFGPEPPTHLQFLALAQAVAVLCDALQLEIGYATVTTHAEAAYQDGYGPGSGDPEVRWDLLYIPEEFNPQHLRPGGVALREKAILLKQAAGKQTA